LIEHFIKLLWESVKLFLILYSIALLIFFIILIVYVVCTKDFPD
jgi:hypothetical protein